MYGYSSILFKELPGTSQIKAICIGYLSNLFDTTRVTSLVYFSVLEDQAP